MRDHATLATTTDSPQGLSQAAQRSASIAACPGRPAATAQFTRQWRHMHHLLYGVHAVRALTLRARNKSCRA